MDRKPNIDRDIDLTKLDGLVLDDEKQISPVEPIAIVNTAPDPEKEVSKKKSKKLLIILLSIFGFIAIVAGILVWLFQFKGIYFFQGLPLELYSNKVYSINIPVGYEKLENNIGESGTDITFLDPKQNDTTIQSRVYISSNNIEAARKQTYISQLDATYTDKNIELSKKNDSGFNGQANIKYDKSNYRGFEARRIDCEPTKGKERIGHYSKLSLFKDGKIYEIIVSPAPNDQGLVVDIDKIFTSFTLK